MVFESFRKFNNSITLVGTQILFFSCVVLHTKYLIYQYVFSEQRLYICFLPDLVCLVHDVLAGLEVEAGLLVAVVYVRPGLQVGDVQRVTQRLHVRPQDEVVGAKQRLDPVAHLVADLQITRS